MNWISSIIGYPLGWVMWAIFKVIQNYGVALFVFTVVTRVIMLPSAVNQQKSSAKMAIIKPKMEEIQKKYAKNSEKLNEEMSKLYKSEGYNPMSGCLPLLIQFPILFGLIDVIYKPLTHILHLSEETIAIGQEIAAGMADVSQNASRIVQLSIIRGVSADPDLFSAMGKDAVNAITEFAPKLYFLGINLMETPQLGMYTKMFSAFDPLIIIPVLSGVTALAMSLVSLKTTQALQGQGGGGMKGMMLMMPVFSTWITFSVPAGVGLYWSYSSIVAIVQSLIMHRVYNPAEIAEKVRQEQEERKERERLERIEAKKKARESGESDDEQKALSQKEINRKKLAEARKRDAEKYGEEYDADADV